MNTPKILAFLLSLSMAATLALAQGPGGGGGGNPGGGGNQPGGGGDQPGGGGDQPGGQGGSFTYDDVMTWCTTNSGIVLRDGVAIGAASTATTLTAPAAMTGILEGAFAGNTAITAVNLSSATSLTEIPPHAFAGCTALKTVTLPASCTAVGDGAFAGCASLATLTATGLATVGDGAFEGCASLTALPAAATALGEWSFAGTGLASADLSGRTASAGAFARCTALASAAGLPDALPDALFSGCTALEGIDASGFASLGTAALAGVPFDEITLADDVALASYALAADTETTWVLNWNGGTDDETVFLGRNVESDAIDIAEATITGIDGPYTAGAFALAPVLAYEGETLVEGTDYTWAVDSADYLTTAGTYTATFTGIGAFTGTQTLAFTVVSGVVETSFASISDIQIADGVLSLVLGVADDLSAASVSVHVTDDLLSGTWREATEATVTVSGNSVAVEGIDTGGAPALFLRFGLE